MTELPLHTRVMLKQLELTREKNPEIGCLLELSVGRVIAKAIKRSAQAGLAHKQEYRDLKHIADWLKAALVNDAPWLRNLDAEGRPKKLMKFGTLDDISREADRDMLRRSRKTMRVNLPVGSEEIVATLEGGYTVVRLLTVEALDAETAEMQHCVGDGAYDDTLTDGKTVLLSLRDPNGKAHVTIEVVDNLVEQVQGKQNKPPNAKYIPLIAAFFKRTTYDWQLFGDGSQGFVIDVEGAVHSTDDLPDELHAHGSLVLRLCVKMPSVVTAGKDIMVHCLPGQPTPRRIVAGRDVNLWGSGFETCPELEMNGALDIGHTLIEVLPPGLSLTELYVTHTPLAALPDDVRCTGPVVLTSTDVQSLPSSLWMRDGAKLSSYGSVDLSNSPISDLGGLDTVQGSLRLNRTKVAGLPANFTVAKTLALKGMKDFRIGAGLCVGDFTAADSDIYFSGDSLTAGRIKLEECGVSFPSTIRCDNLILSKSTIVNVPENIECGGRLYFHTCFSDGFPGRIRTEELWLYKMRCGEFTRAMADLDGDIKAIILAVDDGKLRLGRGFNAGLVAVFDKPKFFTGMSVATARDYLGTHAGSPGALERFARDHGITLLVPGWPSDAKPGSAEEKLRWAEYEFGLS